MLDMRWCVVVVWAMLSLSEGKVLCPDTCFCDFDSSLMSCGGNSGDNGNSSDIPAVLLDAAAVDDVRNIIQRLDYRDLNVPRLEKHHLRYFAALSEFSLVRCHVVDIENAAFVNTRRIERIDLSQNLLTALNQVLILSMYPKNQNSEIHSSLTAVSEQFQSNFRAVSEQYSN